MFWKVIAALVFTCISTAAFSDAPTPQALARTSSWEMNYDTDSCRLFANFGEGDDKVIAMFTRFQPGDAFELKLIGNRLPHRGDVTVGVATDFSSDGSEFQSPGLRGTMGEFPLLVVGSRYLVEWQGTTPPAISPEQEAAVRSLTVRVGRSRPFRLLLGSMGATMRAMRECTTNLVGTWGLDAAQQAAVSRRPVPLENPGSWLRTSDFPENENRNGRNGLVQFRLMVEPEGTVSNCVIQGAAATSGADFATRTCEILTRRARFQPALAANGAPIRSYYVETVRWMAASR